MSGVLTRWIGKAEVTVPANDSGDIITFDPPDLLGSTIYGCHVALSINPQATPYGAGELIRINSIFSQIVKSGGNIPFGNHLNNPMIILPDNGEFIEANLAVAGLTIHVSLDEVVLTALPLIARVVLYYSLGSAGKNIVPQELQTLLYEKG